MIKFTSDSIRDISIQSLSAKYIQEINACNKIKANSTGYSKQWLTLLCLFQMPTSSKAFKWLLRFVLMFIKEHHRTSLRSGNARSCHDDGRVVKSPAVPLFFHSSPSEFARLSQKTLTEQQSVWDMSGGVCLWR